MSSAFIERMKAQGIGHDRDKAIAMQSFNTYFNSFRKEKATVYYPNDYNGEKSDEWEFIIQDRNLNNNDGWADEKIVILPYDTPIATGVIFFWSGTWWLVVDREYRSLKTHQQLRAREVNRRLHWNVGDRQAQWPDGLPGQPVLVQPSTQHHAGVTRTGVIGRYADSSATLYFQRNDDSESIKRGDRIVVGKQMFRVMTLDTTAKAGIITIYCEEHFVNEMTDDMEIGLANAEKYFPPVEAVDAVLGPVFVKPGENIIFKFNPEYEEQYGELVSWKIDGEDLVNVMSQSGPILNLMVRSSFKNIGQTFDITAKTERASSTLTVTIINPF